MVSRLAEAAGCQRSYLSRVMGSEVQLTPDHIYGIADYLRLSESETEFLLTQIEFERSASQSYRAHLKKKLQRLQKQNEDLQKKVQRSSSPDETTSAVYYSHWMFVALHILVSIPHYQTARAMSERLQLPLELVNDSLVRLNEMGLVKYHGGRWSFGGGELHVSKDSPWVALHHQNWRQRAVLDAQKRSTESVHFTVVQSLDEKAWQQVKQKLIEFIEQASKIAGPAKEEKLICLCADFFEV